MECISEVIETALSYCNTVCDSIDCLYDLYINADNEEDMAFIKEKLNEMCEDNQICPACFSELNSVTSCEDRGEYFGFPVKENVVNYYECKYCGYRRE